MEQKALITLLPTADKWVCSPLRNRLLLKLNANVEDVWALVGDPANMPQYSEGLRKVETAFDKNGNLTGYICFFNPMEGQHEGAVHHSTIIWYEENKGWASIDPDSNSYGLLQSLSLMTLEKSGKNTTFTWNFHFNCSSEETLGFNKEGYKKALNDISKRLIKRFDGVQVENYVEAGQAI